MSNELRELSPEVAMAMQTALSILGDVEARGSVREMRPTKEAVISEPYSPDEVDTTSVEPLQTGVRHISDRDAIPIAEKHVLVMWGLSTYRFAHPRGVTFAVDNSRANVERDQQYRDAIAAATELAQFDGLPFVYVLD